MLNISLEDDNKECSSKSPQYILCRIFLACLIKKTWINLFFFLNGVHFMQSCSATGRYEVKRRIRLWFQRSELLINSRREEVQIAVQRKAFQSKRTSESSCTRHLCNIQEWRQKNDANRINTRVSTSQGPKKSSKIRTNNLHSRLQSLSNAFKQQRRSLAQTSKLDSYKEGW